MKLPLENATEHPMEIPLTSTMISEASIFSGVQDLTPKSLRSQDEMLRQDNSLKAVPRY